MANIITVSRIILSALLLFVPLRSAWFWVLFVVCGLTDMADGFIARRTNTVSKAGAKLDSIADIVFVVVCAIKILPMISIPVWLWIWLAIIVLIRVMNLISGYVLRHRLVLLHTIANKATGLLLFLLPLTIQFFDIKYYAIPVCVIATFAAIQEGYYIRIRRDVI